MEKKNELCIKHKRDLELWCTKDNSFICIECTKDDHCDHSFLTQMQIQQICFSELEQNMSKNDLVFLDRFKERFQKSLNIVLDLQEAQKKNTAELEKINKLKATLPDYAIQKLKDSMPSEKNNECVIRSIENLTNLKKQNQQIIEESQYNIALIDKEIKEKSMSLLKNKPTINEAQEINTQQLHLAIEDSNVIYLFDFKNLKGPKRVELSVGWIPTWSKTISLQNSIFLIGGRGKKTPTQNMDSNDCFEIDCVNCKLIKKSAMFCKRAQGFVLVSFKKEIFAIGGWSGESNVPFNNSIEAYNIDKAIWDNSYPKLPFGLNYPAVSIINNSLYVIGGHDRQKYSNKVFQINLQTRAIWDEVNFKGDFTGMMCSLALPLSEEIIFIIGGEKNNVKYDAVYQFNTDSKEIWLLSNPQLPIPITFDHTPRAIKNENAYYMFTNEQGLLIMKIPTMNSISSSIIHKSQWKKE